MLHGPKELKEYCLKQTEEHIKNIINFSLEALFTNENLQKDMKEILKHMTKNDFLSVLDKLDKLNDFENNNNIQSLSNFDAGLIVVIYYYTIMRWKS